MNLFLDTNIYLGFYKLSGDDLEELRKLSVAVRSGDTLLYLPQQVREEFARSRERVIAESLRLMEEAALPKKFPRMFMDLEGYAELRAGLRGYEEQRAALIETVRSAATDGSLQADALIAELFDAAQDIPLTEEIFIAARRRMKLGNPPGKDDPLGDAIPWESLLETVPRGEDLLFVGADGDFLSKLDSTQLSAFLREEWARRMASTVTVYPNLTDLFRNNYPDIRLAAELEKELAISRLVGSGSFRETHAALRQVEPYAEFTAQQAQALLTAANQNPQIRWIIEDDDVYGFFTWLAREYEEVIDPAEQAEFWGNFESDEEPGGWLEDDEEAEEQ